MLLVFFTDKFSTFMCMSANCIRARAIRKIVERRRLRLHSDALNERHEIYRQTLRPILSVEACTWHILWNCQTMIPTRVSCKANQWQNTLCVLGLTLDSVRISITWESFKCAAHAITIAIHYVEPEETALSEWLTENARASNAKTKCPSQASIIILWSNAYTQMAAYHFAPGIFPLHFLDSIFSVSRRSTAFSLSFVNVKIIASWANYLSLEHFLSSVGST